MNQEYFVEFTISLRVQSRFFAHFPHLSLESYLKSHVCILSTTLCILHPTTPRSGFTAWAYCKVRKTILFCIFYPVKFCTFEDVLPPKKNPSCVCLWWWSSYIFIVEPILFPFFTPTHQNYCHRILRNHYLHREFETPPTIRNSIPRNVFCFPMGYHTTGMDPIFICIVLIVGSL